MTTSAAHENGELWVFGYGSLMWRPGFAYLERMPARLIGLHRSLCVFSFVHRGTPERPGLVLGLDRGGMCRGIAYRVAAAARDETIDYLRGREQVTSVYVETVRQIELEDKARRRVRAVCYIVDRSHVQYAGRLTLAREPASRAAGPRQVGSQSRLCHRDGARTGGARLSRRRVAFTRRASRRSSFGKQGSRGRAGRLIASNGFLDKPIGRAFDGVFELVRKRHLVETRRDRIEDFDDDRSRQP